VVCQRMSLWSGNPESRARMIKVLLRWVAVFSGTLLLLMGIHVPTAQTQGDDKIAYASDQDGNLEIYVMNADGSNVQRLTFDPAQDSDPTWSPDHRQIAFVSNRSGRFAVYVMSAEGESVRQVTPDDGNYYDSPAWSPDGRLLAVISDRSGSLDVYTIEVSSRMLHAITADAADDYEPTWSPDGRYLAFTSFRDSTSGIYMAPASSGPLRSLLVEPEGDVSAPVWSPDGQHLAYVTTKGIFSDLLIANADGSSGRLLIGVDSAYIKSPSWSPDSRSLIYELAPLGGPSTLQLIDLKGQSATQLTAAEARASTPSWSSHYDATTPYDPGSGNILPAGSKIIVAGESKQATLEPGGDHRWTLVVANQSRVSIGVVVEVFGRPDAYLEVYDSSNRLIAQDDDSGGNLNPHISSVPVRPNAAYTLVVGSRNRAGGTYSISVAEVR